jgi:hypothetical protein
MSDLIEFNLVLKLSLVVLLLEFVFRLELSINVFLDLLDLIFELLDVSLQFIFELHTGSDFFSNQI